MKALEWIWDNIKNENISPSHAEELDPVAASTVRQEALYALPNAGGSLTVTFLVRVLGDPDVDSSRGHAARALSSLNQKMHVKVLQKALDASDTSAPSREMIRDAIKSLESGQSLKD